MKKTFNINLGGIVFHIDEDAYELLDQYLSNLRIHFSKEEGCVNSILWGKCSFCPQEQLTNRKVVIR